MTKIQALCCPKKRGKQGGRACQEAPVVTQEPEELEEGWAHPGQSPPPAWGPLRGSRRSAWDPGQQLGVGVLLGKRWEGLLPIIPECPQGSGHTRRPIPGRRWSHEVHGWERRSPDRHPRATCWPRAQLASCGDRAPTLTERLRWQNKEASALSKVCVPPLGTWLKKPKWFQKLQLCFSRRLSSKAMFRSHWS